VYKVEYFGTMVITMLNVMIFLVIGQQHIYILKVASTIALKEESILSVSYINGPDLKFLFFFLSFFLPNFNL